MHTDIARIETEDLGREIGEDRVGALTDVGGPAQHGHPTTAIGADDHARVGHAVPVDGCPRPRHIRRAANPDPAPATTALLLGVAKTLTLLAPAGRLDHLVDALAEPDGGYRQMVGRLGERLVQDASSHVSRIEAELLGRLVDLAFEGEPGLRRAVAAFGPTGRLVGEHPRPLELVHRHPVGDGVDDSGVEGRGDAVRSVGAAVQPRLDVAARDVAVAREARLQPHQHRMTAPVDVKDFLAGEGDLDRAARDLRELAGGDLVGEGIELAPEAAPHRGGDHADVGGGHVEDLGQQPMDVVGCLCRRPEGELLVGSEVGHRRVLLHGQVRVALEEEDVLAHEGGGREGGLHVAELERHVLVDVGPVPVLVDAHLGVGERLLDRHQGAQRLVVDLDQLRGALGRLLVHRRHRGQRVAHHADLGAAERLLVLRHGEDAELHGRKVVPRDDRVHAWQLPGPRGVDPGDEGVRVRAAQELGKCHAGQHEIVGVLRVAGDLGPGVDLRAAAAR